MNFKKAIIGLVFLIPSMGSSQLSIDSSLLNNSDKWKSKIGTSVIANQLKKVSVGPIETIRIDEGEKNVKKSNNRGFQSENGAWGIVNEYHHEKKQPFDITAIYNGKDSILITMKMVTISEGQATGILHSKKELPETGTVTIFCEETIIKTKNDTTQWYLKRDTISVWDEVKMCYVLRKSFTSYTNVKIRKIVSSKGDTISIYPVKGFRNKVNKMSLPEGIVFIRKDEQIAAYQFDPGYMWIRKDLQVQDKRILGGAIVAILSDYNNSY